MWITQSITASTAEMVIPVIAPLESRVLPPAPSTEAVVVDCGCVVWDGGQGVVKIRCYNPIA